MIILESGTGFRLFIDPFNLIFLKVHLPHYQEFACPRQGIEALRSGGWF